MYDRNYIREIQSAGSCRLRSRPRTLRGRPGSRPASWTVASARVPPPLGHRGLGLRHAQALLVHERREAGHRGAAAAAGFRPSRGAARRRDASAPRPLRGRPDDAVVVAPARRGQARCVGRRRTASSSTSSTAGSSCSSSRLGRPSRTSPARRDPSAVLPSAASSASAGPPPVSAMRQEEELASGVARLARLGAPLPELRFRRELASACQGIDKAEDAPPPRR